MTLLAYSQMKGDFQIGLRALWAAYDRGDSMAPYSSGHLPEGSIDITFASLSPL